MGNSSAHWFTVNRKDQYEEKMPVKAHLNTYWSGTEREIKNGIEQKGRNQEGNRKKRSCKNKDKKD